MTKSLSSLSSKEIKSSGFDFCLYKGFDVTVSWTGSSFELNISVYTATDNYDHDGSVSIYHGTHIYAISELKEEVKNVVDGLKEDYGITNGRQIKAKALELGECNAAFLFIEQNWS